MGDERKAVLITGARGFIGRAVQKLLLREGYDVIGLDRAAASETPGQFASERDLMVDISDAERLRKVSGVSGT